MPLAKIFGHGGVTYPLDDGTSETLLKVADPPLHYAIELFTFALQTFVGPALLARAALEGYNFPSAVEKTLHFSPVPFLLADQAVFPLFCLYRSEDVWDEHNIAFDKSTSIWEWAYVLPPLTPHQIDRLNPIFRSVSVVMSVFAGQSFDPRFEEGATLRDLSGIQKMTPIRTRYGNFEEVDVADKWWRAVSGQIRVQERDFLPEEAFKPITGVNFAIDMTAHDGSKEENFVEVHTAQPPTIETVAPVSGSKAGGTPMIITGAGFRVGTRPRVLIGGAFADNVLVTHPTRLTCVSPSHDATPTFEADVQVVTDDGESNVLEAAFTFTTP